MGEVIHVARPYHDLTTPFTIDENGAIAEYIINDPELMPQLAIGATILIKDKRKETTSTEDYSDFWYAGRIVGLKSVAPFNPERTTMLYREDTTMDPSVTLSDIRGPHTHQPMVIQVFLNRELSKLENNPGKYIESSIQRPPSGYSYLYFPEISQSPDSTSPTLADILNVPGEGLDLGMIGFGNKPYGWKGNSYLHYRWDIKNLDNKHVFIVGESGSGKTVLLKNIAYEIKKSDSSNRIILTDVQGDITQILFPDFVPRIIPKDWQPVFTDQQYIEAQKVFGKFRLIVPKTNDESIADVNEIKKLALKSGVDVKSISLRFQDLDLPSNAEYLFRTTSIQAAPLLDDLAEGLHANKEPASISRLLTALSRLLTKNPGSQITVPTSGVSYNRVTFEATRRILNDLQKYFDMDLEALSNDSNPLDAFDFNGTIILYLDHLSQDERFMWEMQLVSWLYQNKKKLKNTYVFFDEAHQIIPAERVAKSGGMGEIFNRLRSNFEKLAREGRKFRLNLILSTQNPQDLHPIVPEQCPTRIIMKINPKNAQYAFLEKELAYVANSFGHGQFWIQSPFNGTPDWIRVHSIAPPLPHTSMEKFRDELEKRANNKS
ncbi:MAG: ATP-binding protein [Chitinophagaceae bacterium]|nr:ATP-binding protein [Chitinophagaceae bacterium]